MRTLSIAIEPAAEGRTVLSLLKRELACSSAHISRLKRRETGICLNGARCYVTARVRTGDLLVIEIGDLPDGHIVPMEYTLDVRYEDDDLLIIDKPAGIAVHQSTREKDELTLENAVCRHLGGNISPHPVSRLDRGTTGLMAFAKSGYIHERLRRQMHTNAFFRSYLGVAVGRVEPPKGTIELPIGMAEGSTYRRAVRRGGQAAKTQYESICGQRALYAAAADSAHRAYAPAAAAYGVNRVSTRGGLALRCGGPRADFAPGAAFSRTEADAPGYGGTNRINIHAAG